MDSAICKLGIIALACFGALACSAGEGSSDTDESSSVPAPGQRSHALCLSGGIYPSCRGECGHLSCSPVIPDPAFCCACDAGCELRDDCCCDHATYCGAPPPASDSCVGHCGDVAPSGCRCDDECLAAGACCGDFEPVCSNWPIVFGDAATTAGGTAIAVDSRRNVYIGGRLGGAWDFGSGVVAAGGLHAVSFDNLGAARWSTHLATSTSSYVAAAAVDSAGRPHFAGAGVPFLSVEGGYVDQLDADSGAVNWGRFFGFAAYFDIVPTSTGVTTAGMTVSVGGGTALPLVTDFGVDGRGQPHIGSADPRRGIAYRRIAKDELGNNYVTVARIQDVNLFSYDSFDTLTVSKLTPRATRVWSRDVGGLNVHDIALDGSSTFGAGACPTRLLIPGPLDANEPCLTAPYVFWHGSAVVFKLSSAGNPAWQTGYLPTSGRARFHRVLTDAAGRLHVLGHTTGQLTLGPTSVGSDGVDTLFVALFDGAGNVLEVDAFAIAGAGSSCVGHDMDLASNGVRYVVGELTGSVQISGVVVSAGSSSRGFVARVP